jgi:hypothetical protein
MENAETFRTDELGIEAASLRDSADEIERLREHIAEQQLDIVTLGQEMGRMREALTTYACRCGDGECYKDEFVASCGRSAREALGLVLTANSLPYAQEIAAKALEEKK